MISLTQLEIVDLALRFAACGQLSLLMFWFGRKTAVGQKRAYQFFVLCIISYILLTTPIADEDYGWLRRPLLLVTDLTAFSLWFLALKILKPNKSLLQYPKWVTIPVAIWCMGLAYFFLFSSAKGIMHDINHVIGFITLAYVVFVCSYGYFDDLIDKRRNARLRIVIGCGIYMAVLTLFELVLIEVKNFTLFSFINALIIALLSSLYTAKYIAQSSHIESATATNTTDIPSPNVHTAPKPRSLHADKLAAAMDSGIYKQQAFSIGTLSETIGIPEHQLRKVINQELGFSNFSHYLNSYRIPYVCRQLEDKQQRHIPILTLALEAGYGSIAPFNRAFKHHMGKTPSQYRDQFQ
ncbi:MAG: hypothetical protein AXW14_10005 [Alteromonas sp. Nap_26]|nr:MAG: hypothetical protein AXW14_10005 [Alteromonas sp. Nap_26]